MHTAHNFAKSRSQVNVSRSLQTSLNRSRSPHRVGSSLVLLPTRRADVVSTKTREQELCRPMRPPAELQEVTTPAKYPRGRTRLDCAR